MRVPHCRSISDLFSPTRFQVIGADCGSLCDGAHQWLSRTGCYTDVLFAGGG
jgi:hypothetical protein